MIVQIGLTGFLFGFTGICLILIASVAIGDENIPQWIKSASLRFTFGAWATGVAMSIISMFLTIWS